MLYCSITDCLQEKGGPLNEIQVLEDGGTLLNFAGLVTMNSQHYVDLAI